MVVSLKEKQFGALNMQSVIREKDDIYLKMGGIWARQDCFCFCELQMNEQLY